MNKKLILAGAVAVLGFVSLTAFDGKTLEQQKAEIAQMVTSKLDAYRAELTTACDARVDAEAQTRFEVVLAARAADAAAAAKPGAKTTKKTTKGSSKPLQPATPPAKTPLDEKKDKMQGTPNTDQKQDKMQQAPNTDKKKAKMQQPTGGGGK